MDEEAYLHADLANITYLEPSERISAAQALGYDVDYQDADRALFFNPKTAKAVLAFRGTDLKRKKNAIRDIMTDTAILFGKGEKTPRYMESERVLAQAIGSKKYSSIETTGHSLGGHQALYLGKEYGIPSRAFNPAFTIKEVATSVRDRLIGMRRPNLQIFTTAIDPVSFGAAASLTGKVYRVKRKRGYDPHALEHFRR